MSSDTITLEFSREVTKEQMAVLRTLAILGNDSSFESFLWRMIRGGVQAELSGPLSQCGEGYERLQKVLEL